MCFTWRACSVTCSNPVSRPSKRGCLPRMKFPGTKSPFEPSRKHWNTTLPIGAKGTLRFMSLISPEILQLGELWFYRVGGFVLLNVLDDPAWLALMFC